MVITLVSHTKGPQFEPGLRHDCFFVLNFPLYFVWEVFSPLSIRARRYSRSAATLLWQPCNFAHILPQHYFSRPCRSTYFIKRKAKSFYQGWGENPQKQAYKNDYMAVLSRPARLSRALDTRNNCLNPAIDQADTSSATLARTSSIVCTRRSKILLFLSFQSSQQVRTSKESKHLRPSLEMPFLANTHQSAKLSK